MHKLRDEAYTVGCKYRTSLQRLKALLQSNHEARQAIKEHTDRIAHLESAKEQEANEALQRCTHLQEENSAFQERLAEAEAAALKAEQAEETAVKRLEELEEEHARVIDTAAADSSEKLAHLQDKLAIASEALKTNADENDRLFHLLSIAEEEKGEVQRQLADLDNMLTSAKEEKEELLAAQEEKEELLAAQEDKVEAPPHLNIFVSLLLPQNMKECLNMFVRLFDKDASINRGEGTASCRKEDARGCDGGTGCKYS